MSLPGGVSSTVEGRNLPAYNKGILTLFFTASKQ